jgi:hypothetical protein
MYLIRIYATSALMRLKLFPDPTTTNMYSERKVLTNNSLQELKANHSTNLRIHGNVWFSLHRLTNQNKRCQSKITSYPPIIPIKEKQFLEKSTIDIDALRHFQAIMLSQEHLNHKSQ